jgi:C-terminal processing protease CtpA/Prc
MIGNKCFVTAVKPKSDAEAKGVKPGDEIYSIDGFEPTRENLWKIEYTYYTLRPRARVKLVLQAPDGKQREVEVAAKIELKKRVLDLTGEGDQSGFDLGEMERQQENQAHFNRHRYLSAGDTFVWKMPQFDLDSAEVDDMMGKVNKHKSLILDLRGNGGGLVSMLERLAGYFSEQDTVIADPKGRKKWKPMLAKTRGDRAFKGKLVVLIDARSGSASELFSRFVQLQKRGTVIGDRSAGAVMMSRVRDHELGQDAVIPYGVSVTEADVIMSDGKSLEKTGVMPDELLLPTARDLAGSRDPVLARAAAILGVELSAEKAGLIFPIEWRP